MTRFGNEIERLQAEVEALREALPGFHRYRDWLRRQHAQGAVLAAMCTATFMLAEADLLGGTPFRVASTLALRQPGREVVTGTNLQLLLEMVMERGELTPSQFREQALCCGHRGLTSLVDELARERAETLAEEGI